MLDERYIEERNLPNDSSLKSDASDTPKEETK
jgi:hypothetical protein